MQSVAPQNSLLSTSDSKSARKKKAKGGSVGANGVPSVMPAVPTAPGKEDDSSLDAKDNADAHSSDHPYIRDLTKQIRNIHKKVTGMQKTEAIIAENPNVSLDDLVSSRKINADQKASILKKPQLEAQLTTLEDQVLHYRKFDTEFQTQLQRQKEELTAQHDAEMEKVKEDVRLAGVSASEAELRKKLLVFSQFLRCAAAKRTMEEEPLTDESKAFEGALLLVYGGDDKAVSAAMKLIEGADEQVPSIEGVELPVTYSQIKQSSIEHAPFQMEENWVDSVAEANAISSDDNTPARDIETIYPPTSDPTIAYAGLNELEPANKDNSTHGPGGDETFITPLQGDAGDTAGNAAGDKWDPTAPGADRGLMDDSYEMIPRPQDEVDTPGTATQQQEKMSWADDMQPPAYDTVGGASGNLAGESWDLKGPGDQVDDSWAGADRAAASAQGWTDGTDDAAAAAATAGAVQEDADGFQSVPGRHRGRGGFRGRFGDGEFRGRGGRGRGGFRGDGEFRGRGRGGFRGRGEGGEFRGPRGGRGRGGFRGNGEGVAPVRGGS